MPHSSGGTRCCTQCSRTATSPRRNYEARRGRSSSSGRGTSTRSSTSRASSAGRRSSSPRPSASTASAQVELGGLQVKTTLNMRLQGLGRPRDQLGPAHPDRSRCGARVDRSADRRREGHGQLPPERAQDAVQPCDAGPPVDGQRLQADHARDRAERGRLASTRPSTGRPRSTSPRRSAGRAAGTGTSTTPPTRRRAR